MNNDQRNYSLGEIIIKKNRLLVSWNQETDFAWIPVGPLAEKIEEGHYVKGYLDNKGFVITEIIAHKADPEAAILRAIEEKGVQTEFSKETLLELEKVKEFVSAEDLVGRTDFTQGNVVTIDSEDAKDLDDAVSVARLANGNYLLDVHIADVSHYVKEFTALDKDAYRRGTSIYMADRVIPMLPKTLSNGICSLNENIERLTLTCRMEINSGGTVIDYQISPSFIKTKFRMTYTNVNRILADDKSDDLNKYKDLVPMFFQMNELAAILRKKREASGAINFETVESYIVLNDKRHVVEIKERTRHESEKLIEEFMLLANETVAKHISKMKLPFIYRVHEDPEAEKVIRALDVISAMNIFKSAPGNPVKRIRQALNHVKDTEMEKTVSQLFLRSMAKARYSEDNIGHFGLAFNYYTHFTSPIRRYPDLVVHRLLRRYLFDKKMPTDRSKEMEKMNRIGLQTSKTERTAIDLEREVESIYKGRYLKNFIGKDFVGRVSSVTAFGLFVELDNTCEGLIHVSSLPGYYHFLENLMILVNERNKECFQLADKLLIRVEDVDFESGKANFRLLKALNPHKFVPEKKAKGKKNENRRAKQKNKF
ncbi:MAG: ribonuclease R [Erysipelotrichales bacterium]|nr:ribonuclease R [Erysipelotrichales bacterium]